MLLIYLLLELAYDVQQLFGVNCVAVAGSSLPEPVGGDCLSLLLLQPLQFQVVGLLCALHIALQALKLDEHLGFVALPLFLIALPQCFSLAIDRLVG